MENKIEKIDSGTHSILFKGNYHFLNNYDFKKLCDKLGCTGTDINIIITGNEVHIKFKGDLSDLGNEIGVTIGDYITNDKIGYEKDDFIIGFDHGISIIYGTHG